MMSDALTAASIINNALLLNDITDTFIAARARRDRDGEIAHLRAWLEWYERRHQAVVAALQPALEAAKAQDVERERELAKLQRENHELRNQNAELAAGKKAAEDKAQETALKLAHWRLYGVERPANLY
jgi:chromosome segregation ATPase